MYDSYVIMEGDTLNSIASKLKTSPEIIETLNNNFSLIPGSVINVPKSNDYFDYYQVERGDTLYNIASLYGIDVKLLSMLNGINVSDYIYPKQVLLVPKKGVTLYITATGDTLDEIVKGFNVSLMDLVKQNKKIYLQPEQLIVYK
ncbi:MAG: LysM peptidoglycan-binding domain-containing protein [Bacilli bacterium]|nr:LysM peptidoglycan-binding domain-containing protein [Bacilli bacterium]